MFNLFLDALSVSGIIIVALITAIVIKSAYDVIFKKK